MCAPPRLSIASSEGLILRVLAPLAGTGFAGYMTVTESVTLPGIGLVAVFVAPRLVELYLQLRYGRSNDDTSSGPS